MTKRSGAGDEDLTWKELPNAPVTWFDVDIATIPSEDRSSFTPDGDDWLPPTSKIGTEVTGAARSRQELRLAWSGARKVAGARQNRFAHPHVGLAVINVQGKKLLAQHYIWNPEFAFAWPSLAANVDGQVGVSLAWGGGAHYAQHGVGLVKGGISIATTTSGKSAGSGGHYVKTRVAFPNVAELVAGASTPSRMRRIPRRP